jgi:hypothetical protein
MALVTTLVCSLPAEAAITWNLQPPGTGGWDWTLSGENWTFTNSDGPNTPSYKLWGGIAWAPAAGECIEIATLQGSGTLNPDTRLWIYDHGTYRSVNDDFGSTLQSKMRLWIGYTTGGSLEYYVKVAAYSSAHNSEDYGITTTRRDLSRAACTTGQTTIPWAAVVGGGGTYTVTLSPNAH